MVLSFKYWFWKIIKFWFGVYKNSVHEHSKSFLERHLNDWHLFCDSIDIERPQDILDAPLWYNKKLLNGNGFCIYEWYRKGIRYVSDLLGEQGNIYDFENFKTRFGLRGTFLDFQALIRNIPKRWKTTLNNNKNICIINKFNVRCNVLSSSRTSVLWLNVPHDLQLRWANSKGFGETAWMRRVTWTFAVRICNKGLWGSIRHF